MESWSRYRGQSLAPRTALEAGGRVSLAKHQRCAGRSFCARLVSCRSCRGAKKQRWRSGFLGAFLNRGWRKIPSARRRYPETLVYEAETKRAWRALPLRVRTVFRCLRRATTRSQSSEVEIPNNSVFDRILGNEVLEVKEASGDFILYLNMLNLWSTFQQVVVLKCGPGSPSTRQCLDHVVRGWVQAIAAAQTQRGNCSDNLACGAKTSCPSFWVCAGLRAQGAVASSRCPRSTVNGQRSAVNGQWTTNAPW